MFLPNPGILAAGTGGRTYAEFVAHISELAVDGARSWNSSSTYQEGARIRVTSQLAISGTLVGSPWQSRFRASNTSTTTSRLIQHCMPSQADFDDLRSDGSEVYLRLSSPYTSGSFDALNRNGFTSSSAASSATGLQVLEFIYWLDDFAWKMQPHLGLGPTPYDW